MGHKLKAGRAVINCIVDIQTIHTFFDLLLKYNVLYISQYLRLLLANFPDSSEQCNRGVRL